MNISIQITNLPQIRRAFRKAPAKMVKELNDAIRNSVLAIKSKEVTEYRDLGINIITGGLMGSIQRGQYLSNLYGEVGPNVQGNAGVDYAIYVHDGTRYMRPRPFLLNAVNSLDKTIEGFFKTAVKNVLNDIGRNV